MAEIDVDKISGWSRDPDLNTEFEGMSVKERSDPANPANEHMRKVMAYMKALYEMGGSGGGGGTSNIAWLPAIDGDGNLSWTRSSSTTAPNPFNVVGPKGEQGQKGDKGDKGDTGEQGPKGDAGDPASYDDTALASRVTAVETALDGHTVGIDVPADAVFTDTVYDDTSLAARVTSSETAIADRYTKAETDAAIAASATDPEREHFHVVTVLPTVANAEDNHEYVVVEYGQDSTTIVSETHYLFYGGAFHQRNTSVSLDGYATEQYVDAGLADKAAQSSVVALENTAEDLRIANEATQTELTDFKADYVIDMAGKQTMLVINWQYEFFYAELLEMLKSGGAVVEWGNQTYMSVVGFEDKVVEDVRTINVFVHNTASTDGISLYWFTWTVAEADKETVKMSPDSSYHEVTAVGVPWVAAQLSYKQDTLVSGTNIKTVNGNDLLGEGNLVIAGGDGATLTITTEAGVTEANISQGIQNLSFLNMQDSMYVGGLTENGFDVPKKSYMSAELAKKPDYVILDIANFDMNTVEFTGMFFGNNLIYIKDGYQTHLVTQRYTWDMLPEIIYELSYIENGITYTYQYQITDEVYYNGKFVKPNSLNLEVGVEKMIGTYKEANIAYGIYSKVIKIDALPSAAGTTTYDHGISNIKQILQVYGFCSNGFVMNAPRQNLQDNISVYQVSKTTGNQKISIEVGKDRSSLSAYVCLVYAKNN